MTHVLGKIYDYKRSNSWAASFRQKRVNFLKSLINTLPTPIKILDVGGRVSFWSSAGFLNGEFENIEITIININVSEIESAHPNITHVIADARNMKEFKAKEFDVVFSNSVIEHVGGYEEQSQMALEVMRVGKRYFIQTPNRFFPIEPHFVFPFFQFLPIATRVWLLTNFSLGWFEKFTDKQKALELVNEIKLLSKTELVNLFPGANLYEENILGLTKSLIVYGGW